MSEISNKVFAKNKALPWQTIEGETIIINPGTQSSFELNEIGSFIWQRMDGVKKMSEVATEICLEYDVSPEEVSNDLYELIQQMQDSQLIVARG